jgi:hypothetical protein
MCITRASLGLIVIHFGGPCAVMRHAHPRGSAIGGFFRCGQYAVTNWQMDGAHLLVKTLKQCLSHPHRSNSYIAKELSALYLP